jgi:hypothetical protein
VNRLGIRMGAVAVGIGALVFWYLVITRGGGESRLPQALMLTVIAILIGVKSMIPPATESRKIGK